MDIDPDSAIIKHIHLQLDVDFENTRVIGKVTLTVLKNNEKSRLLSLDTKDLTILEVTTKSNVVLEYVLQPPNGSFGSKLNITLPDDDLLEQSVVISYETSREASGLLWLTKEQTAGKEHPFMFSQFQAIHCRSFVPCQDTPSVKTPYTAEVLAPAELTVLMSAIRQEEPVDCGSKKLHKFSQKIPIPSYLIALAIGNLESRKVGRRCSVWAEPQLIEKAEYEFGETAEYLNSAEFVIGRYEWEIYDVLILPPSFPFGGMENPCITFLTPTLLAGDRSLADVVIHEISHSWTGNTVTNANFEHFWLNEGFTMFLERKILERLHGQPLRHFSALEGLEDLRDTIKTMGEGNPLTALVPNLKGIDPDDAFSVVPYEKGHTFLFYIETLIGKGNMDRFLREYIQNFKYKSITTDDFKNYLLEFFPSHKELDEIDWNAWLYSPGMPPVIPDYDRSLLEQCQNLAQRWLDWNVDDNCAFITDSPFKHSDITEMSPRQVRAFLGILFENEKIISEKKCRHMNDVYGFNTVLNCEVKFMWLRLCIRTKWNEQIPKVLAFLNSQGRMKYVRPLYRDLYAWEEARAEAIKNFGANKQFFMHVCATQLKKDLHLEKGDG